jgi:hypothetical protein
MEPPSEFEGFESRHNGFFQIRNGRGRQPEVAYSNKKLCFVATDQQFLAQLLRELADREDCYFVKFTTEPKDGMYLGRCFLVTDAAVGGLWRQYKVHPRLMCTVQDDDFTEKFREISEVS